MHETVVSPAAAHCALPSSPFPHCSNKVRYSTTDGDLSDSFNVLTMLTAHVPSIQSHPSESPPASHDPSSVFFGHSLTAIATFTNPSIPNKACAACSGLGPQNEGTPSARLSVHWHLPFMPSHASLFVDLSMQLTLTSRSSCTSGSAPAPSPLRHPWSSFVIHRALRLHSPVPSVEPARQSHVPTRDSHRAPSFVARAHSSYATRTRAMNCPCLLCMRLFSDTHVADAEHVPSLGSQKHASVTERAEAPGGTRESAARRKKLGKMSRLADFRRRLRAMEAPCAASRTPIAPH